MSETKDNKFQLTREQMIEDVEELFQTIEQVHPNMFATYLQNSFENDLAKVEDGLEATGDTTYLYTQVAPLVANLGDGHTIVYPPDDEVSENDVPLFPFDVEITPEKEIFVKKSFTDKNDYIPAGSQIKYINNRPVTQIIEEMLPFVSGERDYGKLSMLEEYFILLLHILYHDNTFIVNYNYKGTTDRKTVKGLPFNAIGLLKMFGKGVTRDFSSEFSYEDNVCIITFVSPGSYDEFNNFLAETFQTIKKDKIDNLIVDIRENLGTDTLFIDSLFQYISPVPFQKFSKVIRRNSEIEKAEYKKWYDDKSKAHQEAMHKSYYHPDWDRKIGIEVIDNIRPKALNENKLRFKGNTILLTSHKTFGFASTLAWAFSKHKMGTVIGEETGSLGAFYCDPIQRQLSHSKLTYGISLKKYYNNGATEQTDHGALPDIQVKASEALDYAIEILKNKEQKEIKHTLSSVYLLWHCYEYKTDDGDIYSDDKLLGVFSSVRKAEKAIEYFRKKKGFKDYPNDFIISEYKVNEKDKGWADGFSSADEDDDYRFKSEEHFIDIVENYGEVEIGYGDKDYFVDHLNEYPDDADYDVDDNFVVAENLVNEIYQTYTYYETAEDILNHPMGDGKTLRDVLHKLRFVSHCM